MPPKLASDQNIPFEFIVVGKPISHQTKDKQRLHAWKDKVRKTAEECWPLPHPLGTPMQVIITHYYDADRCDLACFRP